MSTIQNEETQLQKALSAIKESKIIPGTSRFHYPVAKAAKDFGVSRYTLIRRLNGVHNQATKYEKQQKLSSSQEEVLVAWIKELGYRDIPWTVDLLKSKAESICGAKIGIHWARRFLHRHVDLKLQKAKSTSTARAQALNKPVVSRFFHLYEHLLRQYNICYTNIYNVDEKGVQLGIGKETQVLVDRNQKTVRQIVNGNRELVTILECVCADGSTISPMAIFKGQRTNAGWKGNNDLNAS